MLVDDDSKIRASLPTISYLIKCGAKLLIASHLGRPQEGRERDPALSLRPIFDHLKALITPPSSSSSSDPTIQMEFVDDCIGEVVNQKKKTLQSGAILFLENLRYHIEEEENDAKFSQELAAGVDIFVQDAFGSCHRAHASIAGITQFVPLSVGGFLLR